MQNGYPWKLAGPWYRQGSVGGPPGRTARPILQKYASADFMDRFLAEPQASLKFVCEDFNGRLCGSDSLAVVTPADRVAGDRIKLFLDAHSRFYLVVCELHCTGPGYPSVSREQVCEAGFVVRRFARRTSAAGYQNLLRLESRRKKAMARVERHLAGQRAGKGRAVRRAIVMAGAAGEDPRLAALKAELQQVEQNLVAAEAIYNVRNVEQYWQADPALAGVGAWNDFASQEDRTPQTIVEEIHPLYPLIPDPAAADHSAAVGTIWFGVVPTASADADADGFAKFDATSAYAVRCFVRRHETRCPRRSERADCPGELVWSQATEKYALADFFDLHGSGHKPVNIRLPDINELNRQALQPPAGQGVNLRMDAPPDSALQFVNSGEALPAKGGATQGSEICFFSIPLITIVALFVFRLFLPIVVWLFGLWFLLRLKLCIPPSFGFDVDFAADLSVQGPEFEASIKAEIAVNGSISLGGTVYADFNAVVAAIKTELDNDPSIPVFMKDDFKAEIDGDFDASVDLIVAMATDFSDNPARAELARRPPRATDGLEYFERVSPA